LCVAHANDFVEAASGLLLTWAAGATITAVDVGMTDGHKESANTSTGQEPEADDEEPKPQSP
jgi:hypothetical protein